jgi:hypothetical protein
MGSPEQGLAHDWWIAVPFKFFNSGVTRMPEEPGKKNLTRRGFLEGVALTGTIAAAGAAMGGKPLLAQAQLVPQAGGSSPAGNALTEREEHPVLRMARSGGPTPGQKRRLIIANAHLERCAAVLRKVTISPRRRLRPGHEQSTQLQGSRLAEAGLLSSGEAGTSGGACRRLRADHGGGPLDSSLPHTPELDPAGYHEIQLGFISVRDQVEP